MPTASVGGCQSVCTRLGVPEESGGPAPVADEQLPPTLHAAARALRDGTARQWVDVSDRQGRLRWLGEGGRGGRSGAGGET